MQFSLELNSNKESVSAGYLSLPVSIHRRPDFSLSGVFWGHGGPAKQSVRAEASGTGGHQLIQGGAAGWGEAAANVLMLKGLSENRAREARWAGGTIFHCGGIQTVSSALSEGFLVFFQKSSQIFKGQHNGGFLTWFQPFFFHSKLEETYKPLTVLTNPTKPRRVSWMWTYSEEKVSISMHVLHV